MGEVDGGVARDGGADRGAARDGFPEQPGMGRGCGAATLEKAVAGGCAACGERPSTATLEKASDSVLFLWRYAGGVRAHSEAASGVRVRGVRRDKRLHPIITEQQLTMSNVHVGHSPG